MERSGAEQNLELTLGSPLFGAQPAVVVRNLDINKIPEAEDQEEIKSAGSIVDVEMDEIAEDGHRPKKLRLSKEQTRVLEDSFLQSHNLNPRRKEELANALQLKPRQVEVWFQNRRARTKVKQTEMEFAYLKRCYGSLTEENRRLHMEVETLRAVRLPPQSVPSSSRRPLPAAAPALVMCPRCEHASAAAASAAAASAASGVGPSTGGRSFYRH